MRKNGNQRGYNYRWQKERLHFLNRNPLCVYCQREGVVKEAEVVDHIIPHKGDQALFWDSEKNWQSLCAWHHNSVKQREETGRPIHQIGTDGWPITS